MASFMPTDETFNENRPDRTADKTLSSPPTKHSGTAVNLVEHQNLGLQVPN